MSMPRDFTVNGIGRLGMSIQTGQSIEPLQENSLEFTGVSPFCPRLEPKGCLLTSSSVKLSFAIHAGLSLLEKPQGRQALQNVGYSVVDGWAKDARSFKFGGDLNQMPRYVDEFLRAIRNDFPRVILADVGGPDVIAETRRIPGWDGNLLCYIPKQATGLFYNKSVSYKPFDRVKQ